PAAQTAFRQALLIERVGDELDPVRAYGRELKDNLQGRERRIPEQPGLGAAPEPRLFPLVDSIERIAEPRPPLSAHLADAEPAAAADDQVELDTAGSDVPRQDPISAQP